MSEAPFSEDEVKVAIFSMDKGKSSEPDGFSSYFQMCWDIIKEDLLRASMNYLIGEISIKGSRRRSLP